MRPLLCLIALATAAAYEPFPGLPHETVRDLQPEPGVVFARLGNGIRTAIARHAQPPGKATMRVLVQAGSLQETDPQRGLAHYLEHLAFNGTTNYPPGTLVTTLQPLGIGFGAHTNAHTGMTETVYKIDVPDVQPATLALGLRVLADQVGGMLLLDAEVEKERGIILAEMRDRDGPGRRTWRRSAAASYRGMVLHDRMPIGTPATVQGATTALIRDFYDAWYRPANLVVTVVGDADPAVVAPLLEQEFARVQARGEARPRPALGDLEPGEAALVYTEDEHEQTRIEIERIRPWAERPDAVAERRRDVALGIAMRVLSRRLRDLQEADPQAPFLRGSGSVGDWIGLMHAGVSGTVRPGRVLDTVTVLGREWRRLVLHGVLASELAIEAKAMVQEAANAAANAASRGNAARADGLYQSIDAGQVPVAPAAYAELVRGFADAITPAEIAAALREAWGAETQADARLVVTCTGREAPTGGESALLEAWRAVAATDPGAPVERAVAAWAYPLPNETGNVPVAVKRTDFQPGQVSAQVRFHIDRSATPSAAATGFVSQAWMAGGLGRHSAADLGRIFAGSSVGLGGPSISADNISFSLSFRTPDAEQAFARLRAAITDPGWRADATARVLAAWRQSLDAEPTDLDAVMGRRWMERLAAAHPHLIPVDRAALDALDPAAAAAAIQALIANAPVSVGVVGDIEPALATTLAQRALAGRRGPTPLTDATAWRAAMLPWGAYPAGIERVQVVARTSKAVVRCAWPTDDLSDVAKARRLGLLARTFGERLRERLREELGEAYSPSAWHDPSDAWRGLGALMVEVSVGADRGDTALAVVRAEAKRLADEGVDAQLLAQVVPPMLASIKSQRTQNGWWLNAVARAPEQPFRLAWAEAILDDIAAATPEELSALAKTYLVDERLFSVVGVAKPAE